MTSFIERRLEGVRRMLNDEGIDRDEHVQFFPGYGYPGPVPARWSVAIHGWIYELGIRKRAAEIARSLVGMDVEKEVERLRREADADPEKLFEKRVWPFLVDSEGGETVRIDILGRRGVSLRLSEANGHFEDVVPIAPEEAPLEGGLIEFRARDDAGQRSFAGRAELLEPTGVSVVSDIDDTIKDTNVLDSKELVLNTFFRRFRAIPGMPELYREWARKRASFHYVSGSPWQLYAALAELFDEAAFPPGSFHMKRVAWELRSITELVRGDQEGTKKNAIAPLLEKLPGRSFILVGDSTEQDASIYADLYRRFPDRVRKVYIHDVGDASRRRLVEEALDDVPRGVKLVYRKPGEIESDAQSVFERR